MEIRQIKPADLKGFITLWQGVYEEGEFLRTAPPAESIIESVLQKVENNNIPHFVAIIDNEIIASIEVFPADMCGQSDTTAHKIGVLGMQVKQAMRQQGIGSKLLTTAIAESQRYGYSTLTLEVYESNITAKKLYESFGFVDYKLGDLVILPNGEKTRAIKMHLTLSTKG